ncbi:MAG TPA: TRAP transporter substrate-binding protein [Burkholderiaceae bacterium]|jgi:TRAP-type transport system periplasmic protein|nr:TRAP transporter substrate-binding protein [Burkholderiaceae bacterium]
MLKKLLAAAAFAAAVVPVQAQNFTMKIGLGTMNDIQHQWANWYKEGVEKASNGRITVQIFPRGQLGTIASHIEGMQLGTIEAFTAPADFFAGVDPRFGAFSIPLLFKDPVHAEKVLLEPAMNKEILALGSDKGLQVVSVYTYGPAHYFAKNPIRSIDDFKGKKLRVNATAAERAKMRQFGASAVPMDLAEVVPGIQQGVIDGTMSATAVYVNLKFNDIARTITKVNDTMIVSVAVVSRPWLNKLPPDLRQVVIDEGAKLQARVNAHSRVLDEAMAKRWQEAGGEFVTLAAEDQGRLKQLLGGIGEEITKGNASLNAFYRKLVSTGEKF